MTLGYILGFIIGFSFGYDYKGNKKYKELFEEYAIPAYFLTAIFGLGLAKKIQYTIEN